MSEQPATALREKKAFLKLEAHLLKQAKLFYDKGFRPENITPSQMAAVGNKFQLAVSTKKAQEEVTRFLNKQMEKLKDKEQTASWLKPTEGGNDTLGGTLRRWVNEEKYLPAGVNGGLDHLAALRRFWSNVHGMYRYRKICGEDMPLNEEELS